LTSCCLYVIIFDMKLTQCSYCSDSFDIRDDEGRHLYSIQLNKNQPTIEIRGVDTFKHEGVLYNSGLMVRPNANNSITVSHQLY
jgi:hypothetical protein